MHKKIHFVREYPFYAHLYINKHSEGYFFNVVVTTSSPLNVQTGMTVNLRELNEIARVTFKSERLKCNSLAEFLEEKVKTLKEALSNHKIQFLSVQFNECRGLSVLFKSKKIFLIRKDFATNANGELFSVISYFNNSKNLTKMILKDLRHNIEEQIIF